MRGLFNMEYRLRALREILDYAEEIQEALNRRNFSEEIEYFYGQRDECDKVLAIIDKEMGKDDKPKV